MRKETVSGTPCLERGEKGRAYLNREVFLTSRQTRTKGLEHKGEEAKLETKWALKGKGVLGTKGFGNTKEGGTQMEKKELLQGEPKRKKGPPGARKIRSDRGPEAGDNP